MDTKKQRPSVAYRYRLALRMGFQTNIAKNQNQKSRSRIRSEGVTYERYRKECLLILRYYCIGARVIALIEDILTIGKVLQVEGNFQRAPRIFFAIRQTQ